MTLFLQDTGAAGHEHWIEDLATEGVIDGVFLGPFHTRAGPALAHAAQRVHVLRAMGLEVHFDPMTHGAALPNTDAWHWYPGWGLASGGPRDLSSSAARRAHVEVCARSAETLAVPLIGPTVCLDRQGSQSELAVQLAEEAISVDADAYLQVAAWPQFYEDHDLLAAHLRQLVSLRPQRWLLTTMRSRPDYPPRALTPAYFAGLCRATRYLRRTAPVMVPYGDLFGLPALASGADALGTGLAITQRISTRSVFRKPKGGGQALARVTHEGLLAVLKLPDANDLQRNEPELSSALVPGSIPEFPSDRDYHHVRVLARLQATLTTGSRPARTARLLANYDAAATNFDAAATAVGHDLGRRIWIDPAVTALRQVSEGSSST